MDMIRIQAFYSFFPGINFQDTGYQSAIERHKKDFNGGGVPVPVVYHSRVKRSFSASSVALVNIVNGREI